jgi:hypothetical protein
VGLEKLSIRSSEFVFEKDHDEGVLHVNDPHAFVQAAGYIKHIFGARREHVLFRGESSRHYTEAPGLFRNLRKHSGESSAIKALNDVLRKARTENRIFEKMDVRIHEPLLQHYGLKTTWLDVVDNIWVALWFACHTAHTAGQFGQFLHFERRAVSKELAGFAYIRLVAADAEPVIQAPAGMVTGAATELVDLRVAAPSFFLRPHAQHGLLMRMRGDANRRPLDYSARIRGTIRISLHDALDWLGSGAMLGTHALFPPPYYDEGFNILLGADVPASRRVGSIQAIGP